MHTETGAISSKFVNAVTSPRCKRVVQQSQGATPTPHSLLLAGAMVWLIIAATGVQFGLLSWWLPMPFPQLLLAGLTLILLAAFWGISSLRAWANTVGFRVLVAVHLTRFIGIYFLVLHGQGRLPYAFAMPGGWGDIIVAASAVALLFALPVGLKHRHCWLIWNVVGLAEILFVVITAARFGIANPVSISPLTHLPLGLLPTFLVPIIITSHVILFFRLRKPEMSQKGVVGQLQVANDYEETLR